MNFPRNTFKIYYKVCLKVLDSVLSSCIISIGNRNSIYRDITIVLNVFCSLKTDRFIGITSHSENRQKVVLPV